MSFWLFAFISFHFIFGASGKRKKSNHWVAILQSPLRVRCDFISQRLSNKLSGCVAQIRRLVSWTNVEYEYHWCMIFCCTPFFSQVVRTVLVRSFLAFAMPLAIAAASYLQRTQGQIQTTFPEGWGALAGSWLRSALAEKAASLQRKHNMFSFTPAAEQGLRRLGEQPSLGKLCATLPSKVLQRSDLYMLFNKASCNRSAVKQSTQTGSSNQIPKLCSGH